MYQFRAHKSNWKIPVCAVAENKFDLNLSVDFLKCSFQHKFALAQANL